MKPAEHYAALLERSRPGTPAPWRKDAWGVYDGDGRPVISWTHSTGLSANGDAIAALPDLHEALGELLTDRERLEGALRRYGGHDPICDLTVAGGGNVCSCGYSAALAPEEARGG